MECQQERKRELVRSPHRAWQVLTKGAADASRNEGTSTFVMDQTRNQNGRHNSIRDSPFKETSDRSPLKHVTLNQSPFSSPGLKRLRLSSMTKTKHTPGGIENNSEKTVGSVGVSSTLELEQDKSPYSLHSLSRSFEAQPFVKLEYPTAITFPNGTILKKFYERSLDLEQQRFEKQRSMGGNEHITQYDQLYLNMAELLSFEKVLLPVIACMEDDALKRLQAKVMRDQPDLKSIIVNCRKYVYSSIADAMSVVEQSRIVRTQTNLIREERWAIEKRRKLEEDEKQREEELAQKISEKKKLKELQRLKKLRECKKKFPQNQETWKEVAFLMAELTKLQSDEILWNQALAEAEQMEQEIQSQEKDFMQKEEQRILDQKQCNEVKESTVHLDKNHKVAMKTEMSNITQCIRDMNLSITQIEQGLRIIEDVVMEAETTRKDLYNEFTQHHQFRGYQGIHNSKGLILALSQSQDDSAW